jgi:hypothetical protein
MTLYTLNAEEVWSFELENAWELPPTEEEPAHIKPLFNSTGTPRGLYFSPDGTKMFILGNIVTNRILFKYNLDIAWDLSSISENPDQTLILNGISGSAITRGIYFKPDGSKFFVINGATGSSTGVVYEIGLSDNWNIDISSVSSSLSYNLSLIDGVIGPLTLSFTADGDKMIICGRKLINSISTSVITEFILNEPWSITSVLLNRVRSLSEIIETNLSLTTADINSIYYNSIIGKIFFYNASFFGQIASLEYGNAAVDTNNNLIVKGSISADYFNDIRTTNIRCQNFISNGIGGIDAYGGPIKVNSSANYMLSSFSRIYPDAAGIIRFTDSGNNNFDRLRFGGTTSSFPSIKRNGSGIDIRNANDTAFTALRAADITAGGIVGATSFAFSPSGSRITSSQNGIVALTNNSGDSFGRLQFGGITTSYPSIVRNGSGIDVRDAANTIFTPLAASNITANGSIYATSGIYATGTIITNNDIEVSDFAKGVVLKSSDGSRFRITVNNSGALTTTQL